ncbi:MAG TPA: APC family permease [Streptosporangiaceae bacterium]|nr:APC family permease [Streptosporangiaceae bacterium]
MSDTASPGTIRPSSEGPVIEGTDLQRDAIGLVGATMQAITHIAPAIAALFFTQFVVSLAGITAPLAYLLGVIVVLMLGSTLVQLSKHMPSAGGYYTYVSRALHARAGFLTSWMYVLYSPLAGGPIYGYFGYIVSQELKTNYQVNVPWLWWVCVLVGAPLIAFLQHRGIKISARAMLILGGLEMIIVFVLTVWGFFKPGPGGFTFEVFNFNKKLAVEGFALAVVFSIQGLTGWEGAAPLAEETRNPRRNVPRATMLSIVLLGVFLVIAYWGQIVGWGVDKLSTLTTSSDLPGLVLAHRFWGGAWVILLLAFLNTTIAVCLATANVGTRMWYRMAKNGSFPKALAKVDVKYKTPTNAILAQLALSLVAGIGVGAWIGPDETFLLVDGLVLVLAVLFVYVMANAAVFAFYYFQRRGDFNIVLHVLFPLISSAALIYALIYSFIPFPAAPYEYAPLIDGLWLLLGIIVLVMMRIRGSEQWLVTAGAALGDSDETDSTKAVLTE